MNTNPMTVLDALRRTPLARGLDAEQLALFARVLTLESFATGQVLARQGQTDNHLLAVVSGTLSVVRDQDAPDAAVIATLVAGDFAHELGFLDGSPRFASLVAGSDAQVLVLSRSALESLLDSHPRIVYAVMCSIVRTVHRVQTRLAVETSELTNYIVKQHGRY